MQLHFGGIPRDAIHCGRLAAVTFSFAANHLWLRGRLVYMRALVTAILAVFVCLSTAPGQSSAPAMLAPGDGLPQSRLFLGNSTDTDLAPPTLGVPVMPRMSPELALQVYQNRAALQTSDLAGYSATTVVHAALPDTAQQGEYELKRQFSAPRTLQFTAVHFTGDGFVKNNVISRLLQSEVEHVQKDNSAANAISSANYKFAYKGSSDVEGRAVHIFQLKPRKRRVGLIKGHLYLDVHTGSVVRVEGQPVRSPSFFVKGLRFVQDYADFGRFTFPVHIHSEAKARIVGRTIVDIYQRDYQLIAEAAQTLPATADAR